MSIRVAGCLVLIDVEPWRRLRYDAALAGNDYYPASEIGPSSVFVLSLADLAKEATALI